MACLESAIFSIDLDDDNNMYQEGGGRKGSLKHNSEAQAAVAIQKKMLKIAVNSVNKMKTQMDEAEAKQKNLLKIAVNSVNKMKTQMDEAEAKQKKLLKTQMDEAEAKQKKLLEIAVISVNEMNTQMNKPEAQAKKLLEIAVISVNKMNTQMNKPKKKEGASESESESESEIHEIKAKKLLLSGVFKTAVEMKKKSDIELLESLAGLVAKAFTEGYQNGEKYQKKCRQKFIKQYNGKKINYDNLYDYLNNPEKLTTLL